MYGSRRQQPLRRKLANEFTRPVDCLLALREEMREQMPYVRHLRPHLQRDVHAGRLGALSEPFRIVQQRLGVADVDQEGW